MSAAHDKHHHGGEHEHHHPHAAAHAHAHAPASFGNAFAIGISLNAAFVLAEWIVGVQANSLALIADAAHNLGDVLSLVLAWIAVLLARRTPTPRLTYGLRGTSILVALVNGVALFVITGGVAWEAVQRLRDAQAVQGFAVAATAAVGILVNGLTAWLFMRGSKTDLNIRAAYLHMVADAAVSLAVLIAGVAVALTGIYLIDPLLTLAVSALIIWQTAGLLRESLRMTVQGVPEGVDIEKVRGFLRELPGVTDVHDLHVWAMSTRENVLTAHLVLPGQHPGDRFLQDAAHELARSHNIHHTTLQIEVADTSVVCSLAPEHVV
jgi:cobalt-zinc-cadmium efflux system protein